MTRTIAQDTPISMRTTIGTGQFSATLVLLPGMDGPGDLFEPLLQSLPRNLSVIVVRYPTQDLLNYSQLGAIAEEALPSEGPLILLGESFLGPIAIALATKLGGRVSALILCCTFARSPSKFLKRIAPLSRLVPFELAPIWATAPILLGSNASLELRDLLRMALHKVSPAVLRGRLREIATVDVTQQLLTCEMPILYLCATQDALVSSASMDEMLMLCPSIRVANLEGPHCLLQMSPSLAANAILDFIADAGKRTVSNN